MPLISVLTPTQAHNADHLLDAWAALDAQRLPDGWELEWLVQEDGATPAVASRLPADARIHHAAVGVQLGPAATRNLALARARGDLIAGLDHDDSHTEGGLGAMIRPLIEHDDIAWACGNFRFVMTDGGEWVKPPVFEEGRVPARTVADHFLSTGDFPFAAGFTVYRRVELQAHGGWPAVPRSDDAVLLAAFGDHHDGWWVDRVVADYRRWPQQRSVAPAILALREEPHVIRAVEVRRRAEDALRGR